MPDQVISFKEPGSGLTMHTNQWYILSDSGSCYVGRGFPTRTEALAYANSAPFRAEYGLSDEDIGAPIFRGADKGWPDNMFAANILFGADLYAFWVHTNETCPLNLHEELEAHDITNNAPVPSPAPPPNS